MPEPVNAPSPFHAGEKAVQARIHVRDRVERMGGRMIRSFMPDQHRELFERLPLLFVGSLDEVGRPWASVLSGQPGFITSPDERTLRVHALPYDGDPLRGYLKAAAPLATLGIELSTRRRNRANGGVRAVGDGGFELDVRESFGNCPKYIQARAPRGRDRTRVAPTPRVESQRLSTRALALIRQADTFFIATAAPAPLSGLASTTLDVSHRGGPPGFVRASEEHGESVLTFPDFIGNFLFNTLGNLELEPRAGLLFIDFETGDVLQLTGVANVIWEGPLVESLAAAERAVRFVVSEGVLCEAAVGLQGSAVEFAPEIES